MIRERQDEAMLERLQDVKGLAEVLVHDVVLAVEAIQPGRPDTFRSYVRAVFALVEGALSGMSSYLLEGQAVAGWSLEDDEARILWDAVPAPSVPRPSGGRPTLTERTKAAFKVGRRVLGDECPADFGDARFQAFRRALTVRDRLMHPKRRADLDVTVGELADVEVARDWFRFAAQAFFLAAATELGGSIAARRLGSSPEGNG